VERVAEMLGDGERREPRPPARAGRLVHLSEDQRGPLHHAGALQLEQQLVTFARALADAGEDRDPGMALDRGADQLHDQHGLADAGAAEHRRFAAFDERRQQVDDLDAGAEHLDRAGLARDPGRGRVDRPALDVGGQVGAAIGRLAERVEQTAENRLADRGAERRACSGNRRAAPQPGRGIEGDRARQTGPEVQLDLGDEAASLIHLDDERLVDRRKRARGEADIDDRAVDGNDPARSGRCAKLCRDIVHDEDSPRARDIVCGDQRRMWQRYRRRPGTALICLKLRRIRAGARRCAAFEEKTAHSPG
jgi:hypothetical protein